MKALLAANGGHAPFVMDWGGGLVILPLPTGALPTMPSQARARRLSGALMDLPVPDPVAARLNEGLRARFDPRGILAGPI